MDLRRCYPNARRTPRSAPGHSRNQNHRLPVPRYPQIIDMDPAQDVAVVGQHGAQDPNVAVPAPQGGGQQVPGNGGHQPPPGAGDPPVSPGRGINPQPTPPRDGQPGPGYDTRLKNIEEILQEMRTENNKRARRASTPRRRSPKARSHTRSRARSSRSRYTPTPSPSRRRGRGRSSERKHRSTTRSASRRRRRSSRSTHSRTSKDRSARSRSRERRKHHSSRSTRSRSRARKSRSSRSRSRSRATSSRRHHDTSPRSLRDDPNSRRDIARALGLQYPQMGKSRGKPLPVSALTLEPYRNLPPDLKRRAGDRKSRRDLLLPEYMCGFLTMVYKTLDPCTEAYAAIRHAAQVAEDASSLYWRDVRGWTQSCLAHLQDGGATWLDYDLFHRERTRLSWVIGKARGDIKLPCHEHNMNDCSEKDTHSAQGYQCLHVCALCFYGLDREDTNHVTKHCKKRPALKLIQDDHRNEFKRRNNNNNQFANRRDNNNNKQEQQARPKN